MDTFYDDPHTKPPLDVSLYSLTDPDELQFFRTLTGIQDEREIKQHVLNVQKRAYDIYGYPCIRRFNFLRLNNSRLPGYPKALKLLQDPDHKDPVLLDIGCCFGNDTRKFIIDGWPARAVIASDLREGFWQCGHELFNSTSSSFPVTFIQGDIFDPAFLSLPSTSSNPNSTSAQVESQPTRPNLSTLKSLTPLLHRVSAIHASALFHLFSEAQQLELAQRLAALLLPQKGSLIFGTHVARREKGFRKSAVQKINNGTGLGSTDSHSASAPECEPQATPILMFCHSPSSWRQMWVEQVFNGSRLPQVRVEAELVHYKGVDLLHDPTARVGTEEDGTVWEMQWSVEVV